MLSVIELRSEATEGKAVAKGKIRWDRNLKHILKWRTVSRMKRVSRWQRSDGHQTPVQIKLSIKSVHTDEPRLIQMSLTEMRVRLPTRLQKCNVSGKASQVVAFLHSKVLAQTKDLSPRNQMRIGND
jgi:hypothetical protein